MFKIKRRARIELHNELIPIVPSNPDGEEHVDLNNVQVVTGIMPIMGITQKGSGEVMPTVFVRIDSLSDKGEVSHTYSFHPLALATTGNLLNAMSLAMISDPENITKEIAESVGISTKNSKSHTFDGYL